MRVCQFRHLGTRRTGRILVGGPAVSRGRGARRLRLGSAVGVDGVGRCGTIRAMAAAKKKSKKAPAQGGGGGRRLIARNRRAFFNYEILEKIEAGIALRGSEVKSLRDGKLQLGDAYAAFKDGELYLRNAHIAEYKQASYNNHEPARARKLLLHRRELKKLRRRLEEKGLTLVPLAVYFNARGLVKVELGLGRGKKLYDKRQSIAKREAKRDMARVRKYARR